MKTVVIDTDKIRITNLGNETSEILIKATGVKTIYPNATIRAALAARRVDQTVGSYKHL